MSGKTNKTLNSALGVFGPTERITFTATTSVASGLLYGNSVYRFDTDEDITLFIGETNVGLTGSAGVNKLNYPTLFAGAPEVFSTGASIVGDDDSKNMVVIASGLISGGTLHCMKLKTRGE